MKSSLRALRMLVAAGLVGAIVLAPAAAQGFVPTPGWTTVEQLVTPNTAPQRWPDSSGNRVAFEDFRDRREVVGGDDPIEAYDIYVVDLDTMAERRITPSTTAVGRPAISGDYVVWEDWGNGTTTDGIWYKNLKTGTRKRLPIVSGRSLEISGKRLVYETYRSSSGGWDIWVYTLGTGIEKRITTDSSSQTSPDISGTKIVWLNSRNGIPDIHYHDLETGTTRKITDDPEDQYDPAISGDIVVWEDLRHGNWDIFMYNLKTGVETRVTTNAEDQRDPAISGDNIVWVDERHGNNQIYLYNIKLGLERRMTYTASDQNEPSISGGNIVYLDGRNSFTNYDLYLTRIATPQITISAPSAIPYGGQAAVTGTLRSYWGMGVAGKAVTLEGSRDKKTWTTYDTTTTIAGGAFSLTSNAFTTWKHFRVRFAGDPTYPPGVSATALTRAKLKFSSAPRFSTYTHNFGSTYRVWGYLKPKHSSGSKQIKVKAYRWNGSEYVWKKTYMTTVSNPSGSEWSKYTGYIRLPSKGTWKLRAFHAEDSRNARSYSEYRKVKVQ